MSVITCGHTALHRSEPAMTALHSDHGNHKLTCPYFCSVLMRQFTQPRQTTKGASGSDLSGRTYLNGDAMAVIKLVCCVNIRTRADHGVNLSVPFKHDVKPEFVDVFELNLLPLDGSVMMLDWGLRMAGFQRVTEAQSMRLAFLQPWPCDPSWISDSECEAGLHLDTIAAVG